MNLMKRLGLGALLAVCVTLFASTSAWAAKPEHAASGEDWGTIELANMGDEPFASGVASLTNVDWVRVAKGAFLYGGRLSVTCHNLTPGATYWTPAGTFIANRKGSGKVSGDVWLELNYGWSWVSVSPFVVDIVRSNPDGSGTPVLTGTFPGQFWY